VDEQDGRTDVTPDPERSAAPAAEGSADGGPARDGGAARPAAPPDAPTEVTPATPSWTSPDGRPVGAAPSAPGPGPALWSTPPATPPAGDGPTERFGGVAPTQMLPPGGSAWTPTPAASPASGPAFPPPPAVDLGKPAPVDLGKPAPPPASPVFGAPGYTAPQPGYAPLGAGQAAAAPGYGTPGQAAPGYGTPTYGSPGGAPGYAAPGTSGYAAPGYGAPGYGTPSYGTPGSGAPSYGAPSYGTPGYGAPGYGPPTYGTAEVLGHGPSSPPRGGRIAAIIGALVVVFALVITGGVWLLHDKSASGSSGLPSPSRVAPFDPGATPDPGLPTDPALPTAPGGPPRTRAPQSTEAWAGPVNAYCRVVDRQLKAVPQGKDKDAKVAYLKGTGAVIRAMNDKLRGMSVPPEHKADYDGMLAAWDQVPTGYDQQAAAVAAGDQTALEAAAARTEIANQRGNLLANRLGLPDCADAGGIPDGSGSPTKSSGPVI